MLHDADLGELLCGFVSFCILQAEACGGARYLFLVVKTFVVVIECRHTFLLARDIFSRSVDDVARQDLLPVGKAAGGTYWRKPCQLVVLLEKREYCLPPLRPHPEAIAY